MPIGGHEDKSGQTDILSRFVELAGGKKARIVIIPTASTEPETGKRYPPVFRKLGVADAQLLEVPDRHYANSDEALATLREATGIFISGGDQTRLVEYLGGTCWPNASARATTPGWWSRGRARAPRSSPRTCSRGAAVRTRRARGW